MMKQILCGSSEALLFKWQSKPLLIHMIDKNKKNGEVTSNYPISIFQCTVDEFLKNKDHVMIQARKTGFPIHKEQNFYEVILNEY